MFFFFILVSQNKMDMDSYLSNADKEGSTLLHLAVDSGFVKVHHSLTDSTTHPPTHSLTHSLAPLLTHLLTHSDHFFLSFFIHLSTISDYLLSSSVLDPGVIELTRFSYWVGRVKLFFGPASNNNIFCSDRLLSNPIKETKSQCHWCHHQHQWWC